MRLKGKTALVAGAGRNNGKALSLAFAREGAELILVARKRNEDLQQTARECEVLGAKTLSMLADVSEPDQVNRVVKQGLERFGKVDILLCVAGLRPHKNFWEITPEEWLKAFAVNLHSTFYLAKALAPSMMERKSGNIIVLGGGTSLGPHHQQADVVSSKHGAYGLVKSLALELGPYNIRANLIALSRIRKDYLQEVETTALGRLGTRDELTNTALFLATDQSSYVTGDRILCSGGAYS